MRSLPFIRNFLFLFAMMPLFACADESTGVSRFVAGQHYFVLPEPVKTRNEDKIEVVEVFWYGCSHCYDFEPAINKWRETLADDIDFRAMPMIWQEVMIVHARAFYTALALEKLDELHPVIFKAMNRDGNPLNSEKAVADLFAKHGISQEEFSKAYNSFAVKSGVRLSNSKARSYKVTGTPEMVVNGKYRVTGRAAGGQKAMLEVVDYLVNKEREANAG